VIPKKHDHTRNFRGTELAKRRLSDAAKNTVTVLKAAVLLPRHIHQKITTGTVIWIDPFCGQRRHTARAGYLLQTIADARGAEDGTPSTDTSDVHPADSAKSPGPLAPRDERDVRFETIVDMFVKPAAFLLMTGHAEEESRPSTVWKTKPRSNSWNKSS
jgi:hypothetical protein